MTRITVLTDFGTADGYAAAMAGVIAARAPSARLETASHAIPPGDVAAAALALYRYAFLYPEGTVHLVVVDPGVGTDRAALAATLDGRHFVAPDNGVLTRVVQSARERRIVRLGPPEESTASATFHGRDVFAPAAARLAAGEPLAALGTETDEVALLELRESVEVGDRVEGEVVQVDRFGNLVTNIPADRVPPGARVYLESFEVGPVRRTYADVASGSAMALIGSLGWVEVSVRDGSAADRLSAGRGTRVIARCD